MRRRGPFSKLPSPVHELNSFVHFQQTAFPLHPFEECRWISLQLYIEKLIYGFAFSHLGCKCLQKWTHPLFSFYLSVIHRLFCYLNIKDDLCIFPQFLSWCLLAVPYWHSLKQLLSIETGQKSVFSKTLKPVSTDTRQWTNLLEPLPSALDFWLVAPSFSHLVKKKLITMQVQEGKQVCLAGDSSVSRQINV